MTDWAGDDKGAVAAPSRLAQALDTKTKGHIALAMALRCDDRIAFHVKAALQQGTPREEVTEVLGMAIYMGVRPSGDGTRATRSTPSAVRPSRPSPIAATLDSGPYLSEAVTASSLDEAQALIESAKHAGEIVPAFQDQPSRRDHAIGALPPRQLRRLFDAVERRFRRAAEYREHSLFAQHVDGIVAPLAVRDFASVDV